jgi:hypothetical protein
MVVLMVTRFLNKNWCDASVSAVVGRDHNFSYNITAQYLTVSLHAEVLDEWFELHHISMQFAIRWSALLAAKPAHNAHFTCKEIRMSHKDEGLKTRHRQYWKKIEADSVVLDPGIIAISWEDSTIRLHDGLHHRRTHLPDVACSVADGQCAHSAERQWLRFVADFTEYCCTRQSGFCARECSDYRYWRYW